MLALACSDHDHPHDDHGGHDHGGHGEHGGHGHGHEGASEVITRWGETTQLFVEFPALVVGEESAFAAHLTRLSDHLAIDSGAVVVELTGGGQAERFTVEGPTVPGIFRPVVLPTVAGPRQVTLRLDSEAASEEHELGELIVFASRAGADAAAPEEEQDQNEISYLLEQQWKVPFRVERADARPMRPNLPAFARLALPNDAESFVTAPRPGRVVAVGGRFPSVGQSLEAGDLLFELSAAPRDGADPATLDLGIDQANIRMASAQREVDRLTPLVQQGVVAQRRLDGAQAGLAQAQAELRSARRLRGSLGRSQRVGNSRGGLRVPSPIAGTLAEVLVAPGAWVSAGDRLARVVDRDRLWLDVSVPEAYLGRLESVSGAWFQLSGIEGVFELSADALVSVGTEVDPRTRSLPIRFGIDNERRDLFAGMTARAHLVTDEPAIATAVPAVSVIDDSGTDVVYVQTRGESFERRVVRLGIRDGRYVEVRQGVSAGEWVVSTGAYMVKLASTSTESIGHGHAH